MSTDAKPSKKDCEEFAAALGKPKASLKDKIPLGALAKKSKDDESNKKKYTLKDRINDIKTGFAEISKNMKDKRSQKKTVGAVDSSKAGGPGKQVMSSRRMVYPYTLSAKLAQFPYRYYFDNCWYFRYTVFAVVASVPLFMYFGAKRHSPSNVAEWKEKRREMFTPHH
uniref:Serine/threonine-protein kinase STE20 n=1 Tax=Lygus hesperus TaxID=30085 RepID=A0A0A9YDF9_LYGHE